MADSQTYRKQFFRGNLLFLGICLVILLLFYGLSDSLSRAKLDMTQDKLYTVSDATKGILGDLIDTVQVDYYVSEDLPSLLQDLKRDTRDLFDEFHDLSGGKLRFSIVDPDKVAEDEAAKKVVAYFEAKERGETPQEPEAVQTIQHILTGRQPPKGEELSKKRDEMATEVAARQERPKAEIFRELLHEEFKTNELSKLEADGIRSFPFNEQEASSFRQVKVFSSIAVRYLDRPPEILPVHFQIEALEYELASRILKLTQETKPVVAFFDSRKPDAPPFNPANPRQQPPASEYEGVIGYLGQFFDVRSVALKESDAMDDLAKKLKTDRQKKDREAAGDDSEPPEVTVEDADLVKYIDCLIVAQPDALEPRQTYEINRAVSLGVPTIFFVSGHSIDVSRQGVQGGMPIESLKPGTEFADMLREWGIELGTDLLSSNMPGTASVELPVRMGGMVMLAAQPFPPSVAPGTEEINQEHSLTNRINRIVFPGTTGLKVLQATLEKKGIQSEVLAKTPKQTWGTKIDPFRRMNSPFGRQQGIGASVFNDYQEELLQMKDPKRFQDFLDTSMPLAALLTGKFPFTFEGESVPEWREEPAPGEGAPPGLPGGFPGGFPGGGLPGGFPGGDDNRLLNAFDEQEDDASGDASASGGAAAAADGDSGAEGAAADGSETEEAEEAAPKAHVEPAEGRILVLASADMMKNSYLMQGNEYRTNVSFLQNAVETFGLGDQLLQIRRKQLTVRNFKPGSDATYQWIIGFNVILVPLVTVLCGGLYFFLRRRSAISYERDFIERAKS